MNEVAVIRHAAADVDAYRASTEAANLCKEIVVATSSNIQGRRYVAVEGWQAIAVAHGLDTDSIGAMRDLWSRRSAALRAEPVPVSGLCPAAAIARSLPCG